MKIRLNGIFEKRNRKTYKKGMTVNLVKQEWK